MPLSFRDYFKPIFNVEAMAALSKKMRHYIDRMRGFIRADEMEELDHEPKNTDQNKLNQSQRHFANAASALRNIIEDHKKISLFGVAWKYTNIWSLIKHRLFHKNELPDYAKIVNHKAILKKLTPLFQEIVLARLVLLMPCQDLNSLERQALRIRLSVERALKNITFEQLEQLPEKPKAFFGIIFNESQKMFSRAYPSTLGWLGVTPWGPRESKTVLTEYYKDIHDFVMAGAEMLHQFFADINDDVFALHLSGANIQGQIKSAANDLRSKLPGISVDAGKPSPTDAFREIVRAEVPRKLQRRLAPEIIFTQPTVRTLHELHDARLDGIIDRVRDEIGVEPEARRSVSL